jgi:N-acetyl-anhydromuramyl-L-alanine amidase AmpD
MPHSVHTPSGANTPPALVLSNDKSTPIAQRYWNVNVPELQWTEDCPDFLIGISEKNKGQLSIQDAEYPVKTWEEVQELIGECVKSSSRTKLLLFKLAQHSTLAPYESSTCATPLIMSIL